MSNLLNFRGSKKMFAKRNGMVFLLIGILTLFAAIPSCKKIPTTQCWQAWFEYRVRLERPYQALSVQLDSRLVSMTEPPGWFQEMTAEDWNCTDSSECSDPQTTCEVIEPSSGPGQQLIEFPRRLQRFGLWTTQATIQGDGCAYSIINDHDIFMEPSEGVQVPEFLEIAANGSTSPNGLRSHRIQNEFGLMAEGQPPCQWTERWAPGNWTMQNGVLRTNNTSDDLRLISWDPVPTNVSDVEVLAKVRTHSKSSNTQAQIHIRALGLPGNETSYLVGLATVGGNDYLRLRKHFAGVGTTLVERDPGFDYAVDTWYWVRFRAEGNRLRARVWPDGNAEPGGWTINETDNEIFSGGWVGIGSYDANDDPDLGWFSVAWDGDYAGPAP